MVWGTVGALRHTMDLLGVLEYMRLDVPHSKRLGKIKVPCNVARFRERLVQGHGGTTGRMAGLQ